MRTTSQLRARFLASLAASGAIVGASLAACGGIADYSGTGEKGSSGSSGSSSSGSSSGSSGFPTVPTATATATPPYPTPPPTPTCSYGPPTTQCFTHAQLDSLLRTPPLGGDTDAGEPDADYSGSFDPDGCLPPDLVHDGCCNAAATGPSFNGSTCCYAFCNNGCCGRPFLVVGEARVADICERDDWMLPTPANRAAPADPASGTHLTLAARASAASALEPATREAVAAAWARDAAMEHASIASFARFTLELLALGAPADIVLGAQDAARDEVEHARACFAIASRYAGVHLGPAKLDVAGALPAVALEPVVTAAIIEGCIGETLSALLAEARLARAEDADVRTALRRIANEEAHHAELAWRFVGWAIATGGDEVRAVARRAFATALGRAPQTWDSALAGISRETLRAHGLLDEAAAREVTEHTLADVIAPCATALVGDFAVAA